MWGGESVHWCRPIHSPGAEGPPIHQIAWHNSKPSLVLTMTVAEDPADGLTALAYEIAIGDAPRLE